MFKFIRIFFIEFFTQKLHFPENLGKLCTLLIIIAATLFIGVVVYQLLRLLLSVLPNSA